MSDESRFEDCAGEIAAAARALAARGWAPATSGNFSMRVDAAHAAVTASGCDKAQLTPADVLLVDAAGTVFESDKRPSAETALHLQIYRRFPEVGAILHTHSRTQTVASRLFAARGVVRLQGWELQKAIEGVSSHEGTLELPVFDNSQDMNSLVRAIDAWLDHDSLLRGYLIESHGIYAWGQDLAQARRHLDAFEFLLDCELDLIRLGVKSA